MSRSTLSLQEEIVCIYLLGPPAVVWGGENLSVPRRNVRGLLYYLSTHGMPSSREDLCLLFWPDIPEANARRNLTRNLTHLRRALPISSALVTEGDTVYLDATSFYCDVIEFESCLRAGVDTGNLKGAIDLYRGSFLAGFYLPGCLEFERWMSQERAALENIYLETLSRLLEAATAKGDYASGIYHARRYLESDDLAEEVHRRLIMLYALSGDRSRALRQYETCVSILERELGTKPLSETRAVYETVLEGRLGDLQTERVETIAPPSKKLQPSDVPLIGRSAPIRHLEDSLRRVKRGRTRVVLISGELGIGKSSLLAGFAELCRTQSLVLIGSGQPAEASVPYHPIVEALRSVPISAHLSLSPIWCAEVARILPELRSLHPDLPLPFSLKGEEARIRLFEALCRCLFALRANSGPILLCFDDLHWFDRTSLSWLVYLCRHIQPPNTGLMLIATYRSEDAHRIKGLCDNLARLDLLDEIKLGGLDVNGILELIRSTFQEFSVSENFASKLREATGGNPFFVLETLRALEEGAKLGSDMEELVEFPLPESVREAVDRRLGRLKLRSRQVLEAGAVLGNRFGFKVVRLTAGRSAMETSSDLDSLVSRELLVEEEDEYRFSHDLVRRAVLAAVSPIRLRLLYSRAGKALEKLQPENVAVLAAHFDAGAEWPKALHYHDLSAERAESLHAWMEVESHFERSLEILDFLDPDRDQPECLEQRFRVLSKLTRLHFLQGRLEKRDAVLKRMHDLVRVSDDANFELQTLLLDVQNLNSDARYSEAVSTAEEGLALAERLQDRSSRCRLLVQIGLAYHILGQPVKAMSAFQEANSMIDESGDSTLRTQLLVNVSQVYRVLGDYRYALDCALEAYAIRQELRDPYALVHSVEIGFLYVQLGRFQEASRFLGKCLNVSRDVGVRSYEAHALLAIGGLYLFQCDPLPAIKNCQAALEILAGLRKENLSASALASIGFAYYQLGDLDQGRRWLERSLDGARSIGHRMRVSQVLYQLALLEISAGRLTAAANRMQEGLWIARDIRAVEYISVGLAVAARVERHCGLPDKALGYAREALHYAQRYDLGALEVLARVEIALVLVELDRFSSACEQTRTALSLLPKTHQLWICAEQVHLAHAGVLKRMGDVQGAQEYECRASAILWEKAERIPDPAQRAAFLAKSKPESVRI